MSGLERNYIWSPMELAILLSILGADNVFMFPLPERDSVKRKEFLQAVYSLAEARYISPAYGSGQPYTLSADVEECLAPVASAEKILQFRFAEEEKLAFRLGNHWTVVEPAPDALAYRVCRLTADNARVWFDELPEWSGKQLDTDEEIAALSAVDQSILKYAEELADTCSAHPDQLNAAVSIHDRNGTRDVDRILIKHDGFTYLVSTYESSCESKVYTRELRRRLRDELFGI